MREIKFRAWDNERKIMRSSVELARLHFDESLPYCFYTWDDRMILGKNLVLMQYTGLKDKNGKEIYEGDIIKLFIPQIMSENNGVIDIERIFCVEYNLQKCGYGNILSKPEYIEVIGTIYENPELVEEKP